MKITVNRAILIKRYKRFLTDIKLPNGETTTIHCANTGAMTGCACPNDEVWYSTSSNAKRKYPFSWEINNSQTGHWICVNTLRANQVVEEAILNGAISELQGYETLKREVKYGDENSKIDFYLQSDGKPDTYVEVKSVTLLSDESVSENPNTCINDQREITNANQHQGYFPDAVSLRGQKHLRELSTLAQQGHRAVLLFAILHSGINSVKPAAHIDPNYAKLLSQAKKDGVEILAYKAKFSLQETSQENVISIELSQPINVDIS